MKIKRYEKKSLLLFTYLSLFHLIILLLNFPSEDWLTEWSSSLAIIHGTPLYEQVVNLVNGVRYNAPHHFPVFFYIFAVFILIFGQNQLIGRFFLWISTVVLGLLFIEFLNPKNQKQLQIVIFLFFINPFLFGINFMGLFDQFALIFVFGGLLLYKTNHNFFSGFVLGLGVMTKLFPIFTILVIQIKFFKEKKFKNLRDISVGSIVSIGSIFSIFYYIYNNLFFVRTVLFQVQRNLPSTSIWEIIPQSQFSLIGIFWFQLIILVIFYIILFITPLDKSDNLLCISNAVIMLIFIIILRNNYPQYILWIYLLILPHIFYLYNNQYNKSIKQFSLIISLYLISSLAWIIQYGLKLTNYFLLYNGSIIFANISLLILLIWMFMEMNKFKEVKNQTLT